MPIAHHQNFARDFSVIVFCYHSYLHVTLVNNGIRICRLLKFLQVKWKIMGTRYFFKLFLSFLLGTAFLFEVYSAARFFMLKVWRWTSHSEIWMMRAWTRDKFDRSVQHHSYAYFGHFTGKSIVLSIFICSPPHFF